MSDEDTEDIEETEKCDSCMEKNTELQEIRERHRKQLDYPKQWYESEMETLRQDLFMQVEEKDEEISNYKKEICTLKEKIMNTHPTTPSCSTSSIVARGISDIVRKYTVSHISRRSHKCPLIIQLLLYIKKNAGVPGDSQNMETPTPTRTLDDSGKFKGKQLYSITFHIFWQSVNKVICTLKHLSTASYLWHCACLVFYSFIYY